MNKHFDNYLNVKSLITTYRPKFLVELGAAQGANTVQLLSLRKLYPFKMITVGTEPLEEMFFEVRLAHREKEMDFQYLQGYSYDAIPYFPDNTIEYCSIDTDHKYNILKKELDLLYSKLSGFCILVFHDTFSANQREGVIGEVQGEKVMTEAIVEFMNEHKEFVLIRKTNESCGAMAIGRGIILGWLE